jgi:hypothetical protein
MSTDSKSSSLSWSLADWHLACEAAWVETDRTLLFRLVEAAEASALIRREILAAEADTSSERQAIEDALIRLRILKTEKLKFRDPENKISAHLNSPLNI